MSISFLFATLLEAQETIDLLCGIQAKKDQWTFSHGEIVITGMGKENIIKNCCPNTNFWINLGVAGAFSDDFSVGDFVWIKSVSGYPSHLTTEYPSCYSCSIPGFKLLQDTTEPAHLYTSSVPVYEKPLRVTLRSLVDMEGFFLAELAMKKKAELLVGKIISDHCSKDSSCLIKKRLPELSKKLAILAESIVNAWHERGLLPSH